jgi:hypothetical protein
MIFFSIKKKIDVFLFYFLSFSYKFCVVAQVSEVVSLSPFDIIFSSKQTRIFSYKKKKKWLTTVPPLIQRKQL